MKEFNNIKSFHYAENLKELAKEHEISEEAMASAIVAEEVNALRNLIHEIRAEITLEKDKENK